MSGGGLENNLQITLNNFEQGVGRSLLDLDRDRSLRPDLPRRSGERDRVRGLRFSCRNCTDGLRGRLSASSARDTTDIGPGASMPYSSGLRDSLDCIAFL